MISFRHTIFSAFSFLLAMLALSGLFALLDNSFLFLAQIMVSVGAVVVLGLMVIISLGSIEDNIPHEPYKFYWIVLSAILVTPFGILVYKALLTLHRHFEETKEGYGELKAMGETLFGEWVLPFEAISVLLLCAMVGAVVIARREKYIQKENFFDKNKECR